LYVYEFGFAHYFVFLVSVIDVIIFSIFGDSILNFSGKRETLDLFEMEIDPDSEWQALDADHDPDPEK
jgi:hypothetical protein